MRSSWRIRDYTRFFKGAINFKRHGKEYERAGFTVDDAIEWDKLGCTAEEALIAVAKGYTPNGHVPHGPVQSWQPRSEKWADQAAYEEREYLRAVETVDRKLGAIAATFNAEPHPNVVRVVLGTQEFYAIRTNADDPGEYVLRNRATYDPTEFPELGELAPEQIQTAYDSAQPTMAARPTKSAGPAPDGPVADEPAVDEQRRRDLAQEPADRTYGQAYGRDPGRVTGNESSSELSSATVDEPSVREQPEVVRIEPPASSAGDSAGDKIAEALREVEQLVDRRARSMTVSEAGEIITDPNADALDRAAALQVIEQDEQDLAEERAHAQKVAERDKLVEAIAQDMPLEYAEAVISEAEELDDHVSRCHLSVEQCSTCAPLEYESFGAVEAQRLRLEAARLVRDRTETVERDPDPYEVYDRPRTEPYQRDQHDHRQAEQERQQDSPILRPSIEHRADPDGPTLGRDR